VLEYGIWVSSNIPDFTIMAIDVFTHEGRIIKQATVLFQLLELIYFHCQFYDYRNVIVSEYYDKMI
jgi:hypothetical protein